MLIVDTGVLVAATDRTDRFHVRCVELLEAASGPLVTTAMVIAECSYLIERELGSVAESLLYQSIIDQMLLIEDLTARDWERIRVLVTTYQTLPLGGTDASLIAIAERLGQT
ncbi:MAG: PIN domain-containing protein, partial [Acidimicrobiales bacterium]